MLYEVITVERMRGHGNMGRLMTEMMGGLEAPDDREVVRLVAYLQRNAQAPLDPKLVPEAFRPEGEPFRLACKQCHNQPNPAMHEAAKWPKVVKRMVERMRGHGNMGRLMTEMMGGLESYNFV